MRLGGVEGTCTLPDPLPRRLLFISAGSGITPIMSMLRDLARRGALQDVVHLHSARTPNDVIFGEQLRALDQRHAGYRLHVQHTGECGRFAPADLDRLCPDWREREAFLSGPGEMLDAMHAHWEEHADGGTPILVAGEQSGAALPFGCRMGICHTCVGRLCSGRVRDLRTGKVSGTEGEMVRTCINAPEGPVEIDL